MKVHEKRHKQDSLQIDRLLHKDTALTVALHCVLLQQQHCAVYNINSMHNNQPFHCNDSVILALIVLHKQFITAKYNFTLTVHVARPEL